MPPFYHKTALTSNVCIKSPVICILRFEKMSLLFKLIFKTWYFLEKILIFWFLSWSSDFFVHRHNEQNLFQKAPCHRGKCQNLSKLIKINLTFDIFPCDMGLVWTRNTVRALLISNTTHKHLHFFIPIHPQDVLDDLHIYDFLAHNELFDIFANTVCDTKETVIFCEAVMFLFGGYSCQHMNASRVPVYVSNTPAGTSIWNLAHWSQVGICCIV